jgi:hypothetical protein
MMGVTSTEGGAFILPLPASRESFRQAIQQVGDPGLEGMAYKVDGDVLNDLFMPAMILI